MSGQLLQFLLVLIAFRSTYGDSCSEKYLPHELVTSSNGEKSFHQGGERTLAIQLIQGGKCQTSDSMPTGTALESNTALTTGNGCYPPVDAKLTSFSGMVIQAKGWTLRPSEWIIRNILRPHATVVVFGMRGSHILLPKFQLFASSSLRVAEYEVIGGPSGVPGALRGSDADCEGDSWRSCAFSASFSKPVDSVVVLLADDNGGSVQVGALYSKCGCRCKLVYEQEEHLAPRTTPKGTCWWGASSLQYHKCAEQGIDYCSVEQGVRFVADGTLMDGSDNVPCSTEPYEYAVYEQPFVPQLSTSVWSPISKQFGQE